MLELLKQKKNIYYQFYDDYNIYTERCKAEDFRGYTIVFDEEAELIHDISRENKKKVNQTKKLRIAQKKCA